MAKSLRPLKIAIVGDGFVGKTCILMRYTKEEYSEEYLPTVFENHNCNVTVDDNEYNMTLWDTAGQEDYERLRPLCYPNTHCFLLCYSITDRASFENIKFKWWPEIRHFSTNVPVVLVANKIDMRIPNSGKFVTTAEGRRLCKKIHAYNLVECSAKESLNLVEVFQEAIRAVERNPRSKPRTCKIL